MPCLMKKEGEPFAISASRFQTRLNARGLLLNQPLCELLKASPGVGEHLVLELLLRVDETGVELLFTNVDAKCGIVHKRRLLAG